MDFLLMSYLLYTYDLALPVIAAGMGKHRRWFHIYFMQGRFYYNTTTISPTLDSHRFPLQTSWG